MKTTQNEVKRQVISKGETRQYFTAEVVYKSNGRSRTKHERYHKVTGILIKP
jgi:hypothetical protein